MGLKLKHVSTKMKGLRHSGSTRLWEARKAIPADVRHAFGGRCEFTAALNTKSETEAMRLAAPLLADWTEQIDAVRAKAALAAAPIQRQAIIPECAMAAIQRWKSARLKDAHRDAAATGVEHHLIERRARLGHDLLSEFAVDEVQEIGDVGRELVAGAVPHRLTAHADGTSFQTMPMTPATAQPTARATST